MEDGAHVFGFVLGLVWVEGGVEGAVEGATMVDFRDDSGTTFCSDIKGW